MKVLAWNLIFIFIVIKILRKNYKLCSQNHKAVKSIKIIQIEKRAHRNHKKLFSLCWKENWGTYRKWWLMSSDCCTLEVINLTPERYQLRLISLEIRPVLYVPWNSSMPRGAMIISVNTFSIY